MSASELLKCTESERQSLSPKLIEIVEDHNKELANSKNDEQNVAEDTQRIPRRRIWRNITSDASTTFVEATPNSFKFVNTTDTNTDRIHISKPQYSNSPISSSISDDSDSARLPRRNVLYGPDRTLASHFDPFETIAIRISRMNEQFVFHYVNVLGPSANYASFNAEDGNREIYDPTQRYWLPIIFSDEALVHAMIALSASHKSSLPGGPRYSLDSFEINPVTVALYHKTETCRLINERISRGSNTVTDTSISAVQYLLGAELMMGRLDQAEIHLTGLSKMIEMRGGIDELHPRVKFMVKCVDIMVARIRVEMPRFECSGKSSRNFAGLRRPKCIQHLSSTPALARGLLRSNLSKILPIDVLENIISICEIVSQYEVLEEAKFGKEDFNYRCEWRDACISLHHRLLSFDYKSLILPPYLSLGTESILVALCRITILIFYGNPPSIQLPFLIDTHQPAINVWRFPKTPLTELRLSKEVALLQTLFSSLDVASVVHEFGEALLWVCFFAGFSSRGKERVFWVNWIRYLVDAKDLTSFEEVHVVLETFLYRKQVFVDVFRVLWLEATAVTL